MARLRVFLVSPGQPDTEIPQPELLAMNADLKLDFAGQIRHLRMYNKVAERLLKLPGADETGILCARWQLDYN